MGQEQLWETRIFHLMLSAWTEKGLCKMSAPCNDCKAHSVSSTEKFLSLHSLVSNSSVAETPY